MSNKSKLPDGLLQLFSQAEKANGLPAGTMASVMQQEIGGQLNKFLSDPTAYHYPVGPDGRRVAKHTGKVSTAFGPFGILESTAKDPGYGVKPLQSKDIGEQVRFAAEYLAARSKRSGGLVQGLAAYGEGDKYGAQVAKRMGLGTPALSVSPTPSTPAATNHTQVVTAKAPVQPAPVAPVAATAPAVAPVAAAVTPDPWDIFLQRMQGTPAEVAEKPMVQAMSQYGIPQMRVPDFLATVSQTNQPQPKAFNGFGGLASWGKV
jgi:hypothetical protein